MSARSFIEKATVRGIKLTVTNGQISYTAPEGAVTPKVVTYLREHKAEIISELTQRPPLAVLLELPNGWRFWLAPDGFTFNAGGIPILRRSIMDQLTTSGADVGEEVKHMVGVLHQLGGEMRVNSSPLPEITHRRTRYDQG